MDVSMGTRAWFSDFRRLFQQCVDSTKTVDPAQLRGAFDSLLGLLDYIFTTGGSSSGSTAR